MATAVYRIGWISLLVLLIGATAFRLGLLPFRVGFTAFGLGLIACALVALLAVFIVVIGAFQGEAIGRWVVLFLACALPVAVVLWSVGVAGLRAPPIHDISTDTLNPPQFVFAAQDRAPGSNSVAYGGEAIAAKQRAAYPEIRTLVMNGTAARVYRAAKETAQALGWRILEEDKQRGHLEAVATTRLMGFQDDIVIRIQPNAAGVAVDVRSASRLGVGDLGANARRIQRFLRQLTADAG